MEYTREFAHLARVAAIYGMWIDHAEPDEDVPEEIRGSLRLAEFECGGYDCHVPGVNLKGIRGQLEQITAEKWMRCPTCDQITKEDCIDRDPDPEHASPVAA